MPMEILIVDNHDSFTYNILELLRKMEGLNVAVVNYDHLNNSKIDRFDKVIFSPGPGHVNEYPYLTSFLDEYQSKKSILGICLGHQVLCNYFGAQLINLPTVCHGQELQININNKTKLYQNLPGSITVGLYHSWVISDQGFPVELEITGASLSGLIMSISHRTLDLHGIQFHPESFITINGFEIMKNFIYS